MCAATCVVAPRASDSAYFLSNCAHCHVCVSCSYLSVPFAFSPDSSGCLCRPYVWIRFSGFVVLFRFLLLHFSCFGFPGLALFPIGLRVQILMFFQVNWCFDGPAVVVTFVPKGFSMDHILAFWVSPDVVELSYR